MTPLFYAGHGHNPVLVVVFWVLFYVWIGAEMWIAWRRRPAPGTELRDRGSVVAVVASVWIGMAIAFAGASIPATVIGGRARTALFIAGLVVIAAGMALRWYSIHVLGRSFTVIVATSQDQLVVESGPYRWIRHPSYTGGLLSVLGVILCCTNLVSFGGLVPILLGYAYRIRVEEAALLDGLGDPYRDYMRRTRRLVPFIF
jgi:protein-S-isoprenylcysteine O-methyltransferase Ste14